MRRSGAPRLHRRDQEGFTLMEVVVAVVLIAGIMAAVAPFFVRSVASSANIERRQAAIALADQRLELVRAVVPKDEGLVEGRAQADVLAQWDDGPVELAGSAPAWDAEAVAGSDPVIALVEDPSPVVDGQPYTVSTYIGTCQQPAGSEVCQNGLTGVALYRVIVSVRWNEGVNRTCGGAEGCQYLVSTLINADSDPTFNTNPVGAGAASPVTVDPFAAADQAAVEIELLGNSARAWADTQATGRAAVERRGGKASAAVSIRSSDDGGDSRC